jgi:enamine deaminase RidA (YjgF/YER057c/UK114 family)
VPATVTHTDGGGVRAGTALHLPGITSSAATDLAGQAQRILDEVEAALVAADLGFEHVVRVTEHVVAHALPAYDELRALRAARLGTATPAVSTVVVHGLPDPGALVSLEVTASPAPGRASRGPLTAHDGREEQVGARSSDEVVWVSSCLPLDARGAVVAPGDLVRQTAKVYANAAVRLAALGYGLEDVVKTVEFVKPHVRGDYPRTGRVRKAHLAPPYGGATGIVMEELAHPDALVQVDFVAARGARTAVDCGWERYGKLTYNPGLRVGDVLWMSGQAALDVETEEAVLPGDVVAQAEYTYRNIRTVLEHAGLGPQHLVRSVEYVTPEGLAGYADVAAVRAEVFPGAAPAVTSVVCSGLLRPEFLIEIDPMAHAAGAPS